MPGSRLDRSCFDHGGEVQRPVNVWKAFVAARALLADLGLDPLRVDHKDYQRMYVYGAGLV